MGLVFILLVRTVLLREWVGSKMGGKTLSILTNKRRVTQDTREGGKKGG